MAWPFGKPARRTRTTPRPAARPFRPGVEPLEQRSLPAGVTASLTSGLLHIVGTSAADSIHCRQTGSQLAIDNVKIATPGALVAAVSLASVKEIDLQPRGGADTVTLDGPGGFSVPVLLSGAVAADTLQRAGESKDVLAADVVKVIVRGNGSVLKLTADGTLTLNGSVQAGGTRDVAMTPDQMVFRLRSDNVVDVLAPSSASFTPSATNVTQIALSATGELFALDGSTHTVNRYSNGWVAVSGHDIARLVADGQGTVYALSFVSHSVFQRTATAWQEVTGRDISQLAADNQGRVYALSFVGRAVFQRTGATWTRVSGGDIAGLVADSRGQVYALSFVSHSVFQRTDTGWAEVSGKDIAQLAADSQGQVYVRSFVSHSVFQRTGATWKEVSGKDIAQVGTDEFGRLYALSFVSHSVFQRTATGWTEVSGKDIAQVGTDERGRFYGLSFVSRSAYQRTATGWSEASGRDLAQLGTDEQGRLYGLSFVGRSVYQRTATGWSEVTGRDIAQIASDEQGYLYALSFVSHSAFQRTAAGWAEVSGGDLAQLGADEQGRLYALSSVSHSVFQRTGAAWKEVSGKDIARVGTDEQARFYALSFNSHSVFQRTATGWKEISGKDIAQIGTDEEGRFYGLSSVSHSIFQRTATGFAEVSGKDIGQIGTDDRGRLLAYSFTGREIFQRTAAGFAVFSSPAVVAADGGVWYLSPDPVHRTGDRSLARIADGAATALFGTTQAVGAKWLALGGPTGSLGLPVKDLTAASGGSGQVQYFEHGEIYAPAQGGVQVLDLPSADGGDGFGLWEGTPHVTPDDIFQRESGTCSFLAALSSVARTNAFSLAHRISFNDIGGGWSVYLYDPNNLQGKWLTINIKSYRASDPDPLENFKAFWVVVYQRAYLKLMGVDTSDKDSSHWHAAGDTFIWNDSDNHSKGYHYSGKWQVIGNALTALTGKNAAYTEKTNANLQTIQAALGQKKNVEAGTKGTSDALVVDAATGLIGDHAYTVVSVIPATKTTEAQVVVRNPWGHDSQDKDGYFVTKDGKDDGYLTISWSKFKDVYTGYYIVPN